MKGVNSERVRERIVQVTYAEGMDVYCSKLTHTTYLLMEKTTLTRPFYQSKNIPLFQET